MPHTNRDEPFRLPDMIFSSKVCRSYSNIFEWGYGLPLFVEGGVAPLLANPSRCAPFCRAVSPPDGCCGRCPLSKSPPLQRLEPWISSRPCAAGLNVTFAPIRSGTCSFAWLVTGHHAVGARPAFFPEVAGALEEAGLGSLANAREESDFARIPSLSVDRHEQMKQFLELAGALLGAEVNAILTEIQDTDSCRTADLKRVLQTRDGEGEAGSEELEGLFEMETGMSPREYGGRCRIEKARREFLAGSGSEREIVDAARRAGFWDLVWFQKLFRRFFHESPPEHFRRIKKVQKQLWEGSGL